MYVSIIDKDPLMGLSHGRIFRRITRRVDRFSYAERFVFYPYRTNNVLIVNISYYKLTENLSITYRERCRRTNNLCLTIMRSLSEPKR